MASVASRSLAALARRIYIPLTSTSPPGLVQANTIDPWVDSGKYALAWTGFALGIAFLTILVRLWHFWQDKIRQAIYKEEVDQFYQGLWERDLAAHHAEDYDQDGNPVDVHDDAAANVADNQDHDTYQDRVFFPEGEGFGENQFRPKAHFSSVTAVNDALALFRWIFYRPLPDIAWGKHRFTFSSLAVLASVALAVLFVALLCFLLQPLYWQSIQFGSPPVAIRAGMVAVAIIPWIFATSTKSNVLTMVTGIGPERLNVFHRWLGYLCLGLALTHTIPFYVQPVWDDGGMAVFQRLFSGGSGIIYGTGISCLVPLAWLCVASLPVVRRTAYEIFVALHVPVAFVFIGLLFWHTKNFLMSWSYLWASIAVWTLCTLLRLFNLNWARPNHLSFLVGDEAAVTLMSENCIKITIPTRMRWRPGQYVYLRMPAISIFENHPFTISSLCSGDFPSEYGEEYRDCVLVFRPYGGFTRRVLETAIDKGPFHTYRAFLDGPYGGMRRDLAAFDTCILIAGGSGITSLMSQLLNLIKRMRDGKAITRKVVVVWALKRLEAMDWFREELRICRESAPPESVTCKFFVTSAVRKRTQAIGNPFDNATTRQQNARAISHMFHDRLDNFVAGIASKRNSALIQDEAQGDPLREHELRAENEDRITALPPQKYLQPHSIPPPPPGPPPGAPPGLPTNREPSPHRTEGRDHSPETRPAPVSKNNSNEKHRGDEKKRGGEFHFPPLLKTDAPHFNYAPNNRSPRRLPPVDTTVGGMGDGNKEEEALPIRAPEFAHLRQAGTGERQPRPVSTFGPPAGFDFGFAETPTEFQRSLMRFAFPVPHQIDGGWSVEYGRPDLGYMLREWATGGSDGRGILGRRTAVFVCGPPGMRVGVANTVARLQAEIWGDDELEEIFLHTENYAL